VEELRRLFGDELAFLVEGLTKISKLEFKSAKERQAENFRKMLVAMSKDIRILLIKLADRLHNMRTLEYMSEESRRRIAQETQEIYVPLAHRLGIDWVRRELAELAFRALNPEAAADLERKLKGSRKHRQQYVEEVIGIVSGKLAGAGLSAEVTGRQKELSSVHHKMESQGVSLDEIYDVMAFRVVLEGGRDACYGALGIIHSTWPPVPARFKDYVALPKPNGYQSLHTTVIGPYGERMEVQIRTQDMHRNAEFGIASHWKYKEGGGDRSSREDAKFDWLRQLMERQQELEDPHEFLDVLKVDLFPDAVFVFTPKGDVVNLPKGATPVDFAYAIHSQVGERCSGARVNGKMVPLRQMLRDGDTVEILTSASQRPSKDWLDFAVSGKARSKIRHVIRVAENARACELGRTLLEKEMRRAGLSLPRVLERGELDEVARVRARGGVDDLFAAVGYGKVPAAVVVRALRPDWRPEPEPEVAPERAPRPPRAPKLLRDLFRRPPRSSSTGIRVEGQGDVLVRFANCCAPIPGDEVVGFVTRGRGITVHQKDCRVVFHLDKQRRVDVEWDPEAQVARRIRMKVTSRDEPGLLAKITKTISAAGINIGAARVSTHPDRTATQSFDLWVADVRTLDSVMKEIERIKGILSVERVRA
jgi:GTP pyrophosphokinase